ncbi:MAG: THUMP domain-containing protein [Candidatus Methanofastidiosia archaeon]
MNCIVARFGEIGTKSFKTRVWWEKLLVQNMKACLRENNIEFEDISNKKGRIIVYTKKEKALEALKNVFGIVSLSKAQRINANLDEVKRECLRLFSEYKFKKNLENPRFRVSVRRITKDFALSSREVAVILGSHILENEKCSVDLENYEIELSLEFLEDDCFIFFEKLRGHGGLPVGVQGEVLCILKNENSLVAAWMMLKRGCDLMVLGEKKLAQSLLKFSSGHEIKVFKDFSSALKRKPKALVLGNTLENIELEGFNFEIPIFTPLLGLRKSEIEEIKRILGLPQPKNL